MCQDAQDRESEADKWHSATINLIILTCAFPTVTCHKTCSDKGLLPTLLEIIAETENSEVMHVI